jgi:hypothetical protein
MFTGKVEGSDGTALGDAILGGQEIGGDGRIIMDRMKTYRIVFKSRL